MKKIKNDIILICIILIILLSFWLFPLLLRNNREGIVKVIQNGVVTGQYPLSENNTVTITCDNGYNLLLINDGKVSISDADCPDKLCVRQHFISHNGESIICLPHKLVIQLEAKEESELDSVTY